MIGSLRLKPATLRLLLVVLVYTVGVGAPQLLGRGGSSRWGANYFPNVELTTHKGESVRFFDDLIENKVVVINFIYTNCPDSCPLETARLSNVYDILGDRVGDDVFFYSITIDPERDTPDVLNDYATKFRVGPGWTFLTGDEEDITLLRRKLGLFIEEIQDDGSLDHNLSLIIGNQATGRWMKRSPFENAHFLADQIGSWLHNWKRAELDQVSYSDAPELRNISMGETLFRTRCASCHTIGGGDTMEADGERVGPDLYGVTSRRERQWLAQWIAEPETMLAQKDPIIMEMFFKYKMVAMPNMRLSPIEVNALIDYVGGESMRLEGITQAGLGEPAASDAEKSAYDEGRPHGITRATTIASVTLVSTLLLLFLAISRLRATTRGSISPSASAGGE